ncbi:MAG: serine hydrolase [Gemmatimonadaceae bacterium]|nr:serine hydrolase [Gemmatimonadaceae bacterium]
MSFPPRIVWSHAATLVALLLLPSALRAQQRVPVGSRTAPYPHAAEPIGTLRQIYDGVLSPEMAVNTFRNIDRLLPTRTVAPATQPLRLPPATTPLRTVRFRDHGHDYDLADYLRLNRVAGLLVLKDGRVKLERYQFGNSARTRWMSMSVAKSVTSTLIGVALKDGAIASLSDPVTQYVPVLTGSAYEGVSIRDVLLMASGVRWNETYTDPASDRRRLLEAQLSLKAGSAMVLMAALPRISEPGTANTYNTGETQVAAEILRKAVNEPLATYLSEKIWSRFGMESEAKWWLDAPDGVEIGGSGLSATLRDFGRFGLFVLGDGVVNGRSILPAGWVAEAGSPKTLRGGKALDYGYLWWTGTTSSRLADRAFAAEGIHGQFLYINPAAQVVIVVQSAQPKPTGGAVIDDWSFFDAVVESVRRR